MGPQSRGAGGGRARGLSDNIVCGGRAEAPTLCFTFTRQHVLSGIAWSAPRASAPPLGVSRPPEGAGPHCTPPHHAAHPPAPRPVRRAGGHSHLHCAARVPGACAADAPERGLRVHWVSGPAGQGGEWQEGGLTGEGRGRRAGGGWKPGAAGLLWEAGGAAGAAGGSAIRSLPALLRHPAALYLCPSSVDLSVDAWPAPTRAPATPPVTRPPPPPSCRSYGYDWKVAEAEKNLLRTHTTAVSSRMLYRLAQVGGTQQTQHSAEHCEARTAQGHTSACTVHCSPARWASS